MTHNKSGHIDTLAIHAGEVRPRIQGAINLPIFQSSTFESVELEGDYHNLKYVRLSNTPNHTVLHDKLAVLEGAEAGLTTASGMAAISAVFLSQLKAGDHFLAHETLYGGTHDFVTKDLASLGIEFDFVDAREPDTWNEKLRNKTKLFYVESLTNPLIQIAAHDQVVAFAETHDLVSVIDNTLASPVNFKACEFGYDIAVHSATKYLNGHSDIAAGAVLGRKALVEAVKVKLDHLGGSLDPHAAFLLHRGLKTLGLRVRQHNANTLALAEWFADQEKVNKVHYAALAQSDDYERADKWFAGCGGLMSFELKGGLDSARRFVETVEIPMRAPSLGGVESLITIPSLTSHAGMSESDLVKAGIAPGLIRFAVGIEAVGDLMTDSATALECV